MSEASTPRPPPDRRGLPFDETAAWSALRWRELADRYRRTAEDARDCGMVATAHRCAELAERALDRAAELEGRR